MIETFASYAAIQASRRRGRRLAEKAEELGAIREIDLGIAAALDLDILLVQILEKGLQRLRIIDGYGVLHLLDEDAQQLEVFAEACLPEGDARRNLRVDDPETPACAARSRTTKLLSSEGAAGRLKPLVPGVSSEMATPLRGDRLLALTLGSTKRDGSSIPTGIFSSLSQARPLSPSITPSVSGCWSSCGKSCPISTLRKTGATLSSVWRIEAWMS